MTNLNQIDEVKALANLAGDRKLLIDLAQILCEDIPPLVHRLSIALTQQDRVLTRSLLHKIKNLAATFFASEIVEVVNCIELECSQGVYDSLEKNVQRLSELLNDLLSEVYAKGWSDHQGDLNLSSCKLEN